MPRPAVSLVAKPKQRLAAQQAQRQTAFVRGCVHGRSPSEVEIRNFYNGSRAGNQTFLRQANVGNRRAGFLGLGLKAKLHAQIPKRTPRAVFLAGVGASPKPPRLQALPERVTKPRRCPNPRAWPLRSEVCSQPARQSRRICSRATVRLLEQPASRGSGPVQPQNCRSRMR